MLNTWNRVPALVTGYVISADGKPLDGAIVSLAGEAIRVARDGSYGLRLPQGVHRIEVGARGYRPEGLDIKVLAGERIRLDWSLDRVGALDLE